MPDDAPDAAAAAPEVAAAVSAAVSTAVTGLLDATTAEEVRALVLDLERLDPPPSAWLPHTDALVHLAGSDTSRVGTLAQRAVHALDDAGLVEASVVLATCEAALRRRTKGSATTALARLTRLARREEISTDALLLAASVGLLHPAVDVAERALALVAAALDDEADADPDAATSDAVTPATRALLVSLVPRLDPTLRTRAAAVLGVDLPIATPGSRVPTDPAPSTDGATPSARTPWPAQDLSPAHVRAILERDVDDLLTWEHGLAALVALAHTDRPALVAALADADPPRLHGDRAWWRAVVVRVLHAVRGTTPRTDGLRGVLARLLGDRDRDPVWDAIVSEPAGPPGFGPHLLRLVEIAEHLDDDPVPRLVATPSHTDGSLDVEVLLDRLESAAREGWAPWPLDLEQALLRLVVPPPAARAVPVEHARTLRTPAGEGLARWLTSGGMPTPTTRVHPVEIPRPGPGSGERRWFEVDTRPRRPPQGVLEHALTRVAPPRWDGGAPRWRVPWPLLRMLPHHPEVAAAWLLPSVSAHPDLPSPDAEGLRSREGLPGPAAVAVLAHLLAGVPADRARSVDLVLALTAQGVPWGAVVADVLGPLGEAGRLAVGRTVRPLRQASAAGAGPQVLELLVTALPHWLRTSPRGLPDLLALTSGLVATYGVPEHLGPDLVAALEVAPGARGRVAQECRRLAAQIQGSRHDH